MRSKCGAMVCSFAISPRGYFSLLFSGVLREGFPVPPASACLGYIDVIYVCGVLNSDAICAMYLVR